MTRQSLATAAGVSYGYVVLLESQHPPQPGLDNARRIAKALKAKLNAVFPDEEGGQPAAA